MPDPSPPTARPGTGAAPGPRAAPPLATRPATRPAVRRGRRDGAEDGTAREADGGAVSRRPGVEDLSGAQQGQAG
ncbi:hypothetical protein GCM10010140_36190 [Streptosporangium pseudovulgare]|uniref:Uncharacterized protein n=1 Tax=Streptosporangium pseudovulgare TaxID=35765 RepID=A0ABQ2QXB5_9ACTN|nr:hypothetical protein GCM10010140_36190 [Streptosporangium pseudovulgare]